MTEFKSVTEKFSMKGSMLTINDSIKEELEKENPNFILIIKKSKDLIKYIKLIGKYRK